MCSLLHDFCKEMDILGKPRARESRVCQNDECFDLAAGSLLRSLRHQRLWSFCLSNAIKEKTYLLSAQILFDKISALRMSTLFLQASEGDHSFVFDSEERASHTAIRMALHDPDCTVPGSQGHMCPAINKLKELKRAVAKVYEGMNPWIFPQYASEGRSG
ncbi:hypothetical protein ABW19_dt0209847 [Dactylella cylindrospora]|nr:hypothetical protein ABW19_dt0209847 [Dactylella cylindrospora]